jgi:urea transport system ATP-binding protein
MSFPRGRNVFGALFFRRTKDVDERIREVAGKIFLTDLLDTSASLLSHGQKQWLEIGMLLMQDPELLMLDEPVAGMSVWNVSRRRNCCRRLAKDVLCW